MAERRSYAGNAVLTSITTGINASATSFNITDSTGWPDGTTGPFFAVIDKGLSTEEKVKITNRSGTTLNSVTRGQDGTAAVSHSSGAPIEHVWVASDADLVNKHAADTSLDDHTQYINNGRHDTTARHTPGSVVPAGSSASASSPGQIGSGGVAASFSRSDHVHGREAFGSPVASNPGDTASDGTATTIARSDHRHAREVASGGGGMTFGSVGNSAVGDAAANGTATDAARADHRHGREAFGNVTAQQSFALGSSSGTASTVARSDHTHGTPTMATAHSAENFTLTSTTSTSYVDLPGDPEVTRTVPATGAVLVIVGGCLFNVGNNVALISFRASGANTIAGADTRAFGQNGVESLRGSRATLLLGLTPGSTTFKTVERCDGGTAQFTERQLTVWPLQ